MKNKIKVANEKPASNDNIASGETGIERDTKGEEGPSAFPLPLIKTRLVIDD